MEDRPNRLVFVTFEDEVTRDAALAFCDELVRSFWTTSNFDVEWCSFAALKDQSHMRKAARKAAEADLMVFAAHPDGLLPSSVREWADMWVDLRGEREGSIIGLLDPAGEGTGYANTYTWLRSVALRARMDYLTQAPCQLVTTYTASGADNERVSRVTSVLNDILHESHPRKPAGSLA